MKYFFTELKQHLGEMHPWPIIIALIFLILAFNRCWIDSTNTSSRFLTMEALVERGTFVLDEKSRFTDDKLLRDGKYYSTKPPVLTVAGAGIYYVLHNAFGLDFPDHPYFKVPSASIYIITLILTGGTYFLLLFYFYKTLKLFKINKRAQTLLLLGLGMGTLFLSYSTTLNNHTIAGAFLFIGFYYILKLKFNNYAPDKKLLALAGFFLALAAVIDIPTGGTFGGLFFLYLLYKLPRKQILIYFLLAALPILAIHFTLNYKIVGDWRPSQLHTEFHTWDDGFYHRPVRDSKPPVSPVFIFNIFFGTHGLYSYSPILLFSLFALAGVVADKKHKYRLEGILIALGFLLIAGFYIFWVRLYPGAAYGFRWFIALTPLFFFFTLFFFNKTLPFSLHKTFKIVLVISIIISFIGFMGPWPTPYVLVSTKHRVKLINFPLLANISHIVGKIRNNHSCLIPDNICKLN